MKKVLFLVFVNTFLTSAKGQKKMQIEVAAQANLSFTQDKFRIHYSDDIVSPAIGYWTREKNTNPFFYLTCNLKLPINRNIKIGLQSGIQFHYNEVGSLAEKRTFVAVPLQATIDVTIDFLKKKTTGISIAAGGLFYKIDDYVYKVNNALLINLSAFYEINSKQRIKVGIEKQLDNASFHFNVNNPNSNEVFKYHINRLSLFASYCLSLN